MSDNATNDRPQEQARELQRDLVERAARGDQEAFVSETGIVASRGALTHRPNTLQQGSRLRIFSFANGRRVLHPDALPNRLKKSDGWLWLP